ncbi:hypothetical protein B0J17DRAFT_708106 [Rhizoctonia solani]|nr:hypothetical protein B0J17DRAFT_708106 [Rhizoctonia solani]
MFSRLLLSVCALAALIMVAAQSGILVALGSVDASSHRAIKAAHKRGGKPKGRGGRATWYKPGLGNCGGYNKATDMVVALPMSVYSRGKYCGKVCSEAHASVGW